MITGSAHRILLTSAALGAVIGAVPVLSDPMWAADAQGGSLQPDQMRASEVIGNDVYDTNGHPTGHVVDVILTPAVASPRWSSSLRTLPARARRPSSCR